jgi:hypothetical protein
MHFASRYSLARRVLRRTALAFALVCAMFLPVMAEVDPQDLESLGFDEAQLQNAMFSALRGWYSAPDVPQVVRALPADERVQVIETMGTFAKTYYKSPDFKKGYADAYKQSKPKGFGLGSLNVKAMAKAAAEKAVAEKTGAGKAADALALDNDPDVQLAKRLEAFLAATEDVDFDAKTQGEGIKRFVKDEYEAKAPEWKMCYRAGKETTEAIRAFARDWLAELK